jgi:hypothetical protein
MSKEGRKISFWFTPYKEDEGLHIIEKESDEGIKRRYLKGITSGIRMDGHGERMTEECIKGMQEQANNGEILLYESPHGVNFMNDIGRLDKSEVLPNGDWLTMYRLYDEMDGFEPGSRTLEQADKLWRQLNGIAPYEKKKQIGFSIEGTIPDEGILEMDEATGVRTRINAVDLDGVIVTPKPSYRTSVAAAVRKALDELSPESKQNVGDRIRNRFQEMIDDEEAKQTYYSKKWKLEDAKDESIEDIVKKGIQVRDRLETLFSEYSKMMIQLILENEKAWKKEETEEEAVSLVKSKRLHFLKSIEKQLAEFNRVIKDRSVKKSKQGVKKNGSKRNNSKRVKLGRKYNT